MVVVRTTGEVRTTTGGVCIRCTLPACPARRIGGSGGASMTTGALSLPRSSFPPRKNPNIRETITGFYDGTATDGMPSPQVAGLRKSCALYTDC